MLRPVTTTDMFLEQVVARLDRVIGLLEERAPVAPAAKPASPVAASPAPGPTGTSTTTSQPRQRRRTHHTSTQ